MKEKFFVFFKKFTAVFLIAQMVGAFLPIANGVAFADSITKSPSANETVSGFSGFSNPSSAHSNGGNAARAGADLSRQAYKNYGFNISSGLNISEIKVEIDAKTNNSDTWNSYFGIMLSWNGGSSWTAEQSCGAMDNQWTVYNCSVADPLWGRQWSPGEFSNANFRVMAIAHLIGGGSGENMDLDWIPVTITYTDTASPNMGPVKAKTSPSGSVISPASWKNDNHPYFYWDEPTDSSDICKYWYALDNSTPETDGNFVTTKNYYYQTIAIPDGKHTFYVRAEDCAGNKSGTVGSFEIWVDNTTPTSAAVIDNTSYGPDSFTVGTIKGTASDSSSGVDYVDITIQKSGDNKYWKQSSSNWVTTKTWLRTTGTTSWTYGGIASGNFTEGRTYTVTPRATDKAGNNEVLGAFDSFVWDKTAPVLSLTNGVTSPTNNNTPEVTFTSTEAGAITYGGGCASLTPEATVGSNTITYSVLADGAYSCTITVTDEAGNESNVLEINFIVDTAPPVTAITVTGDAGLNGWWKGPVAPTVTLSTEATAMIFWQWESEGWHSGLTDQLPLVSEGARTLEYYSVDLATNEETPHKFQLVKYDGTAPTAEVNYLPSSLTNTDVLASLINPSEQITTTSVGGNEHNFTENGSFNFAFLDVAGNEGNAEASVDWIDKISPDVTYIAPTPADKTITTNNDPEIRVQSVDADYCELYFYANDLNGGGGVIPSLFPVEGGESSGSEFWWNLTDKPDGEYGYYVLCFDEAENQTQSDTQLLTIDTTPPVIGPHANLVVDATSADGAPVNYELPSVEDLRDRGVTIGCVPSLGSTFPIGITTVTCTATDSVGNSASRTFTITVNPLPVIAVAQAASSATSAPTTTPTQAVAGAITQAPVAQTPTTPEEKKEVKGEESTGTSSAKSCPWWWIVGLFLLVALALVGGFLKTVSKDAFLRKYYYIWPFALSGVAWIAHYFLHKGYTETWFCDRYWILAILAAIVADVVYGIVLGKEEK